jgi:hypothetical protein
MSLIIEGKQFYTPKNRSGPKTREFLRDVGDEPVQIIGVPKGTFITSSSRAPPRLPRSPKERHLLNRAYRFPRGRLPFYRFSYSSRMISLQV